MSDPLPPLKHSTQFGIPIMIHKVSQPRTFLHKQIEEIFKLAKQKRQTRDLKVNSPLKAVVKPLAKNINLLGTKKTFSMRKTKSLETEDVLTESCDPCLVHDMTPTFVVKISGRATRPSRTSIFSKICKRTLSYK